MGRGRYPNPRAPVDAYSGRTGRRGRGNRARAQVSRQLYACQTTGACQGAPARIFLFPIFRILAA